jgi:hypothetical protein
LKLSTPGESLNKQAHANLTRILAALKGLPHRAKAEDPNQIVSA